MDSLQLLPGALWGLAVLDGSLKLIGDGEADDSKSLLLLLIPIVDFSLPLGKSLMMDRFLCLLSTEAEGRLARLNCRGPC
jgi:hypothetical protein